MNSSEIIEQATVEGVILALSPTDSIRMTGDQSVIDKWLPTIRNNKPDILRELQRKNIRTKLLSMLEEAPDTHYAIRVEDATTDPIIVAVGIREIATFNLEIPQKFYDGMALLELIKEHTGERNANT